MKTDSKSHIYKKDQTRPILLKLSSVYFGASPALFPNVLCYIGSSSSLSFKCALRESGCRIGYEPTKNELRLLPAVDIQGTKIGVPALSPILDSFSELKELSS